MILYDVSEVNLYGFHCEFPHKTKINMTFSFHTELLSFSCVIFAFFPRYRTSVGWLQTTMKT